MVRDYFKTVLFTVAITSFMACGGNEKEAEVVPDEVSPAFKDAHTSQNALDYAGTYQGITPCADCEGIEVSLSISMEGTYTLGMKYLGKGDNAVFTKEGKYTWIDGNTIELGDITDGPSKFKVGENQIWQLDMEGNRVEGDLADKYILKKI
jgi:uncharacterized lipoprotein NlpE involved in copper resistance